jgi:hypothetical protein
MQLHEQGKLTCGGFDFAMLALGIRESARQLT